MSIDEFVLADLMTVTVTVTVTDMSVNLPWTSLCRPPRLGQGDGQITGRIAVIPSLCVV